jgi:hypothetical protein
MLIHFVFSSFPQFLPFPLPPPSYHPYQSLYSTTLQIDFISPQQMQTGGSTFWIPDTFLLSGLSMW